MLLVCSQAPGFWSRLYLSGLCRSPSLDEVWGDGTSLEQSRDILFLQQLHCVDAWVAMGSITLTIFFFFFFPKVFVAGM